MSAQKKVTVVLPEWSLPPVVLSWCQFERFG